MKQIFKFIDYIQLFQNKPGISTLIISNNSSNISIDSPSLISLDNLDFDFVYLEKPITVAGKVPLRVSKLP